MSSALLQERLRRNILFEVLSDKSFARISGRLEVRSYPAGEVILEDETNGEELYLLVDGRVRIMKITRTGAERLLAFLHPGDFFGELELVDGRPRSARVIAGDDCAVYVLHRADFDLLLAEDHAFAIRLLQVLSLRLRALNNHFISELEQNARRTSRELKKLEQLIEASKVLNSTLDLDKLLDIILETALRIVDGDRGTVYLIDAEKNILWSKIFKGAEKTRIELPIGRGIAGYVAATGEALNITDAYLDPRFNPEVDRQTGYQTRTILCMPMKNRDGVIIGVFQLLNKHRGVFTADDESFLTALSVHAAIAIEKARLYEEEKMLTAMREEMRLAASIQHDLLPKSSPVIPGYDVAGISVPALTVGGDYYDFIPVDEHRWAVCLGDVTGKGLPAAMLMANVQATLRGQTMSGCSPKECLVRSNRLLFRSTPPDKFVTLFYGVLDIRTGEFTYVNAGQDPPVLVSGAGTERLRVGGIVLGIMDGFHYEEATVKLAKDDVIVVYTDGLTEAINGRRVQYGEKRLVRLIESKRHLPAGKIVGDIVKTIGTYSRTQPQADDITLVAIRRNS
jgi:phosphoserine phosphatase RsbU/P